MKLHESPRFVDNTDWLKAAAILFVVIDHLGYFFVEDAGWWNVIGRLAAPPFFFLLGYAQTRRVPLSWIYIGALLSLLDSWNAGWVWVSPNILFSFAIIRFSRPYVQKQLKQHGWPAFAVLITFLVVSLPLTADVVEFGSEGWLWALFGLTLRGFADDGKISRLPGRDSVGSGFSITNTRNIELKSVLVCLVSSMVYVYQEQVEFQFSGIQLVVLVFGVAILSFILLMYRRGASRWQPSAPANNVLHFIGRHTLGIYTVQLAGSELLIILFPALAA